MPLKPCEPDCTCRLHPAGNISNAPFRRRFEEIIERSPDPKAEVKRIAWAGGFIRQYRPRGPEGKEYQICDTSSLFRILGIRPTSSKAGTRYRTVRKTINPATAERLRLALNLDPVEEGI